MPDPLPELQTQIRQARAASARADYPPALRRRAMAWARDRARQGWSHGRIAAELGLPDSTLSRWKGEKEKETGRPPGKADPSAVLATRALEPATFRPVEVVVAPAATVGEPPLARLTLHTPAGYRVEGLDLDGLIALLGRLG